MGCDIHPIVQVRKDGAWTSLQPPHWRDKAETPYAMLKNRNYDVFAILADVRNGYGFAGTKTGDTFTPIAEPRGLPSDLGELPRSAYNDEGENEPHDFGDHSFSWVTLAELDAVQWTKGHGCVGYVKEPEYLRWKASADKIPQRWCSGVSGQSIITITEEAYKIHRPVVHDNQELYVYAEWGETYAEAVGQFYTDVLPWLHTLGEPHDVRLVFGFDS